MSTNPKTVEGIYRDGKIELLETPDDVDEARVIVTFCRMGQSIFQTLLLMRRKPPACAHA
jgi:hypothetical protein